MTITCNNVHQSKKRHVRYDHITNQQKVPLCDQRNNAAALGTLGLLFLAYATIPHGVPAAHALLLPASKPQLLHALVPRSHSRRHRLSSSEEQGEPKPSCWQQQQRQYMSGPSSSYQKFSAPAIAPLKRQYQKAGGILYRQSVLSQEGEFDACKRELVSLIGKGGSLRLADETTSSVASNRVGGAIPSDSVIVDILRNPKGSIARLINEVEGGGRQGNLVLSEDVPVEVRIYEKTGAGMEWHADDVLFDPAQIEVVLTMENTSDCVTTWEEGKDDSNPRRVEVETTSNSAILIKAGGARHKVSPLKYGRRVILKFVYAREGATLIDGAEQHMKQFASSSSRSKKRKRGANGKKKR